MIFKKNILFIIFIGLLISSTTSFLNLNKYDQIDDLPHSMINGDLKLIWTEAEQLKRDLYAGKNYFNSGNEYTRTYLPSKLLAFYSHVTQYELFENFENKKIKKGGGKLSYLIFQSLFYYLALFFFHLKILNFYNYNYQKCFFITCFLAIEPTLIQWHSSFWSESIFFSLQLITLGLIIHKTNNKFFSFVIGIFVGLMFLQKTVAMFYIFPVIFYLIISKKEHRIISIISLIFGYLIILFVLGYHNFKKTDVLYVFPNQSKQAHYNYLVPEVISQTKNVSKLEARKWMTQQEKDWLEKNKINLKKNSDKSEWYNYQQKFALNIFLNNKIITSKIYIKKIIHHSLLNPVQVYFWHKYNHGAYNEEYHTSSEHKKWVWKRILYSLIIYFFVSIGIFNLLKKNEYRNFNYFIILSILYYVVMLGWMGNTRYFMPSLILISIFFGEGISLILNNKKKKLS